MVRYHAHQYKTTAPAKPAQLTVVGGKGIMADGTIQASRDWLGSTRANLLAWWIPQVTIFAALLVPVGARTAISITALAWMGVACIFNAQRCARTHCRFTGPYYLAMILPVLALGLGLVSAGIYSWLVLIVLILAGGKIIWWVTEHVWGKFS